jgi:protein SCO1
MKTVFGYFLIIFSMLFMIALAFPQFYSNNSSGRIDKNTSLKLDFLKQEESPVVLLFFGYVGCENICPPAMRELNDIYKQLDKTKIKVYFINLLDTINKDAPSYYAKEFHKDFKGVYLDNLGIKKVANKFNLSISKVNNSEINHSGYLYVLKKDYKNNGYTLNYIYTTKPFNEEAIVKDIYILLQNRD